MMCSPSSSRVWPSGGSPTTWCSSRRCPRRPWASSPRRTSGTASPVIACPDPHPLIRIPQGPPPGAGSVATRVPHRSEPRLLVLHALRLKGFADAAVVAGAAGLEPAATGGLLRELADAGLVACREGRLSGWSLTPGGRAEHSRMAGAELEESGCRAAVQ